MQHRKFMRNRLDPSNLSKTFGIMFEYNRLGWGSIASRVEVMLMQFSLTEVIMLGMFLLALLTYLKKRK